MKTNGSERGRPRTTMHVYRGSFPIWLLVLLAPFALVFLASLTIALLIGGAAAAVVLPLFWKRARKSRDPDLIELDPSDYEIVDRSDRR